MPKPAFTSLYDYANRKSNPDMPKYSRTAPVFTDLTMAGHAAAAMGMSTGWIDLANPFAWIAAADYYGQGTGLTWTPKRMNG